MPPTSNVDDSEFFSRGRRQVACWVQKHLTDMGNSPDFPGENLVKWIWEKEWNSSSYPNLLDFWILSTTKYCERVFLVMKRVLVNFWEKFLFNKHNKPLNPTIFLRPVFKVCISLNRSPKNATLFFGRLSWSMLWYQLLGSVIIPKVIQAVTFLIPIWRSLRL